MSWWPSAVSAWKWMLVNILLLEHNYSRVHSQKIRLDKDEDYWRITARVIAKMALDDRWPEESACFQAMQSGFDLHICQEENQHSFHEVREAMHSASLEW